MAFHRLPGSHLLPYGLPLGIAIQSEFSLGGLGIDHNMGINTLPAERFFSVKAIGSPVAYHSFSIVVTCVGRPLPGLFGDLPALTNGIVLQVRDPDDNPVGSFPVERPITANLDWYRLGPESVTYDSVPLGAPPGIGSVAVRIATQPALDAIALEEDWSIGFVCNDDLSGLLDFSAVAFGRRLHPTS